MVGVLTDVGIKRFERPMYKKRKLYTPTWMSITPLRNVVSRFLFLLFESSMKHTSKKPCIKS